jgi:hypothetical protein
MGTLSNFGGARRDRTADLLHAMQALSQLSYGPVCLWKPERIGWVCDFVKHSLRKFFKKTSWLKHNKQLRRARM